MTKLLVIDTETGGIDPSQHSLLTLGAVIWDNGTVGEGLEFAIAEPIPNVTARAMEINRIDLAAHARRAMSPAAAVSALEEWLRHHFADAFESGDKVLLAGHNVGFDVGFLKRLYQQARRDYDAIFSHRTLDTAGVLRFLTLAGIRTESKADSTTAFSELDVQIADADRHTALGDARATAVLLSRLIALVRHRAAPSIEPCLS